MIIRKNQKGFSLIEVMVTLAISIVMLMLVVSIYSNTRKNHAQNEQIVYVLENGRFALRTLSDELRSVGFLGGIWSTDNISLDTSLSLSDDCGQTSETNWAFDVDSFGYIEFVNDATGSAAKAEHDCITAANVQTGNDVLTIKRVLGETETGALANNTVYLRSNHVKGCLWFNSASSTAPTHANCPTGDYDDWRYLANVYYVRSYARTAGDGIPTLCRKTLTATTGGTPQPTMDTVCLAQGVERFQIEFGIDSDSPKDGLANQFVSNPTVAQMDDAVSAKIHVLVRAKKPDAENTINNKTYSLGSTSVTVNDAYYRNVYTTTVMLKNPVNLSNF